MTLQKKPKLSHSLEVLEKALESRYQGGEEIARGGFSRIYRVFDRKLRRHVAMKVFTEEMEFPEEIQRFIEEAQITAQLEHPNIVPIYDQGVDENGRPYLVMKLIKGVNLLQLLHEQSYNPGSEAELYGFLQIFLKVCEALSFAHSRGVIHRDLKPENVMVGNHGEVYLVDWGMLRVVDIPSPTGQAPGEGVNLIRDPKKLELDVPGEAMGTFSYLSPEQASGQLDKMDERTDVFALGALLYEILTQSPIYMVRDREELLQKARACEIVPPQALVPFFHLSPELCRIAMKALHKDHASRYQSVQSMQQEVELFLRGYGRLTNQSFPKGSLIVRDGEQGDTAYLLVSGQCIAHKTIDGKKQVLYEMKPGAVFGEVAAFSSRIRTANVEAIDDVQVKVIDRKVLEQEFGFGSWINRVLIALASRFSEVAAENLEHHKNTADLKLLNRLQLLMRQVEQKDSRSVQVSWSSLQQELLQTESYRSQELCARINALEGLHLDEEKDLLQLDLVALSKLLA